jgi:electron transfer flavoprotein beta subunit
MHIVVCVKQVLDTADTRFDSETGILRREGQPITINPLDEYAVEEALRLKEKLGGTVTALGMGATGATETLRHAIAMGADDAVLVTDPALAGSDTEATARVLAKALAKIDGATLVLCGAQSVDGDNAYVGPAIAQHLGLPCVTFARKIVEIDESKAVVERMMEEGYDRIETPLPAVLTVIKEINEPRISSLKGKMRAKKTDPKVIALADLGIDAASVGLTGATTRVKRTFPPEPRPAGMMLEGEPDEIADRLFAELRK